MIETGKKDLLNEISNRNAIIAQMKNLLEEKDREIRLIGNMGETIAHLENLVAEKDRVLQEQGEIKEREMENRDETIARMKEHLEEKEKEIQVCVASVERLSKSLFHEKRTSI